MSWEKELESEGEKLIGNQVGQNQGQAIDNAVNNQVDNVIGRYAGQGVERAVSGEVNNVVDREINDQIQQRTGIRVTQPNTVAPGQPQSPTTQGQNPNDLLQEGEQFLEDRFKQ